MFSVNLIAILFFSNSVNVQSQDGYFETTTIRQFLENEEKMSQYILKIIEHYKQPSPVDLPGATFTDPYPIPDIRHPLGFASSLVFSEMAIHGVNKYRLPYIRADIGKMKGSAALEMDKLEVYGKYSVNMFLNSHQGHFSANLTGISCTALASLGVERDGKLRAQNISVDVALKNIAVHFDNAGLLAILLQGVFNSMSTFLYNSIKPYMLKDAQVKLRETINKKVDELVGDIEFPNTISPLDMIMIDVRKKIKQEMMDPFKINDYFTSIGIFNVGINNTWVTGLSSFHRMGNVSMKLENHTLIADFNIGTKELRGSTQWQFSGVNRLISLAGSNSFSVNYVRGRFVLIQPLDTRKRMELKNFELDVGNIQLRSDGVGTLDYLLELSANILPNILRYQIINAIQNPIRLKLQQELNDINIEDEIINKLPEIDKMQEDGFQFAQLRLINSTDEPCYDDDEFFNF